MDRPQNPAPARSQPRLLHQVRHVIRRLRLSIRTEQGYVDWIRRFILYLPKALYPCNPGSSCSAGSSIPRSGGAVAGEAFLTALAVNSNVASSTRNHAPNAMALLYGQILRKGFGLLVGVQRARKPARRPILFTRDEGRSVLARLDGVR
jgi:Phage integrase, N-terminal SAM-like domain